LFELHEETVDVILVGAEEDTFPGVLFAEFMNGIVRNLVAESALSGTLLYMKTGSTLS
jgi:hypothetical protein